jgi:RHS repeat-associated protein
VHNPAGNGAANTYGWDQAGELTSITGGPANNDLAYAYDATGQLQHTTNNNATTQLTWDVSQGLPELLADGSTSYIYGPGGLPIEQITANNSVLYYHHDQLGSTRLLTSSSGNPAETISYSPYGTPTITSGSTQTPLLYAGEYTDPATGLIYMDARWYDPTTAQYLSIDPLQALTGQPYNYANDNPTNLTDPTGLDAETGGGGLLDTIGTGLLAVGSDVACTAAPEAVVDCGEAADADTAFAGDVIDDVEGDAASEEAAADEELGNLGCGPTNAAEEGAGGLSRLVIGRTSDLEAPGALEPGEYTLLDQLPDQGSPQANWTQNSSVLRGELRNGVTQIRDASPGNTGGQFLNAERNILINRGWTFDPSTNMWNAP